MNSLNSDEDLASKCIGLCHALASQNKSFSFSLTVGSNFSFSLDTRELVSATQTKKANTSDQPLTTEFAKNNARKPRYLPYLANIMDYLFVYLFPGLPSGPAMVMKTSIGVWLPYGTALRRGLFPIVVFDLTVSLFPGFNVVTCLFKLPFCPKAL